MTQDELVGLVQYAVDELYARDRSLIVRGVHEVTISHRLAVYLELALPHRCCQAYNIDIDIEYNRNGNYVKRLVRGEGGKRPDIIVHRRESNDDNLLIVELKTRNAVTDGDDDDRKLRGATDHGNEFRFAMGVHLYLLPDNPVYTWYLAGQRRIDL